MPDASSSVFTNVSPTANKESQVSNDIPSSSSNCTLSTLPANENNSPEQSANVSDGNEHLPSYSSRSLTAKEKLAEILIPNGNKEEETQSTDRNSENERSLIEEKTKEEDSENSTQVEGTDSVFIDNLKADLYERDQNFSVVRILRLKPIDNSVKAKFLEKSMIIEFKTKDEKFLAQYNKDSDTNFVWRTDLAEKIVPAECSVSDKHGIEIILRKQDPKIKWKSITSPVVQDISNNLRAERTKVHKYVGDSSSDSDCDTKTSPVCDFYDRPGKYSNHRPISEYKSRKTFPSVVPTPKGFTGLRNIGNTCFMNASLQALLNTTELKEYFSQNYQFLDLNTDNVLGMKGELAVAFGSFMQDMWSGRYRTIEPSTIKTLIGHKANQFLNFAQHDAQEFLSFLLDILHEDLNRVTKKPITEPIESDGRPDLVVSEISWRNYKARDDSIIVDLFHGQLKSRLCCPQCRRVSITFDPFVYLPVPFPKPKDNTIFQTCPVDEDGKTSDDNTCSSFLTFQCQDRSKYALSDLLCLFTESETLGPQEAWYCNKCKKHQEAEKTMLLWNLPPLLIIQLKRFCFSAQIRNKIDAMVDYPIQGLDLAPYLCKGAPNQQTVYDLYAVVCHSGSVNFGHYTSFARLVDLSSEKDEIDWRQFDDSHVSQVSESEVQDGRAYLLFYKRRDVDSSKIFEAYRNEHDLAVEKKISYERLPHSNLIIKKEEPEKSEL